MKVLLAAVLVDALHAALEDGERALNRVGVDGAVHEVDVLALAVPGEAVAAGEGRRELSVLARLVGHHTGFLGDVLLEDREQGLGAEIIDDHGALLARVPVDEAQHLVLVSVATALLLALGLLGAVVADEGLVDLDNATAAAHGGQGAVAHGLTDAVGQEPRALVGDAEEAVDLVAAHALLGRAHEVGGLEHLRERDMGALEDGADLHRELLAARLLSALAEAKAGFAEIVVLTHGAAVRAHRTLRPESRFKMGEGCFFAVKVGLGQDGHGQRAPMSKPYILGRGASSI